jgi:HEAT repeat protein
LPDVTGLGWTRVRDLARALSAVAAAATDSTAPPDPPGLPSFEAVVPLLDAPDVPTRLLAVYLLGYNSGRWPEALETLRRRVPQDPSWEVQEALAQAFDAWCAVNGYEAALPVIDAWLRDSHPNVRRAVSEGLRPWTARGRAYFARHPEAAVRRLGALRADPSAYVRHSAGNALRDVRRRYGGVVDAETGGWDLGDAAVAFTYRRVLAPQAAPGVG